LRLLGEDIVHTHGNIGNNMNKVAVLEGAGWITSFLRRMGILNLM